MKRDELIEGSDVGEPVGELDTCALWVTWACPACNAVNHQSIDSVAFGFDIDMNVQLDGHCKAFLEVTCPHCYKIFTRSLS